ncbi:hypothetical protein F4859DRAFT_525306, partial [Xylaria cf. heliscus]
RQSLSSDITQHLVLVVAYFSCLNLALTSRVKPATRMDPVSALGVAAAALQFLDASAKAYNAFQEIRSSAESSTERNKQLEDNIRAAQNLRDSFMPVSAPQGTTDPVSELAAKCASKADELLKLLEYIRGSGQDRNTIQATFRAMKERKKVKKLHESLAEDRVTLDQMISQKLLSSVGLMAVVQGEGFAGLGTSMQKLVSDLVEQRKAHDGKLDSVCYDMRLHRNEKSRKMMREKLLESLFFPQIDQRRGEIKEPAPNTLEWLFRSASDASSTEKPWSNFRKWLREETSMYWISGKAGSGKSTLMAHIVDYKRTKEDLSLWSNGRELKVMSFFFWRAGTHLQNSVLGLLRSLLYQLCRLDPIVDEVLAGLSSPIGLVPTWTERSLLNHITKAIQSSSGFCFCVFIDGLDEYTGPYNDLIDYINQLQQFGNLKVCASSRPELELAHRFQGLNQLRLQDLNRGDIKEFVDQALARTKINQHDRADLAEQVLRRAEGIFLWASLVTQSLVKGSMAGDCKEIMQKRLDLLPRDMDQLFERMLMDVDVVHRESLALYVQLQMVVHELQFSEEILTIPMIAILQLQKNISSYEEFVDECERTQLHITTRSAGLLEVRNDWTTQDRYSSEWKASTMQFISKKLSLGLEGLKRHRCTEDEPYPTILKYESRSMKWLHRSAFDFFANLGEKVPSLKLSMSREELLRKISESCMSYLLAAPACVAGGTISLTVTRTSIVLRFISMWYSDYPQTASALLDNLLSFFLQFDKDEIPIIYSSKYDIGEFTAEHLFWDRCLIIGLWVYMSSRIDRIVSRTLQRLEIDGVVQTAIYKYCLIQGKASTFATWRELDPSGSIEAMSRSVLLIPTISMLRGGRSPFFVSELIFFERLLEQFSILREITDLYVAPSIGVKRILIQLSSEAWFRFSCSRNALHGRKVNGYGRRTYGNIGDHVSAVEVPKAVRILCVPSFDGQKAVCFPRNLGLVGELQDSQFIPINPSPATSDQILNLISYYEKQVSQELEFHIIRRGRRRRRYEQQQLQKVCKLLLQEIKAAEQGLDGGQQLIAAACVKAGLLGPEIGPSLSE